LETASRPFFTSHGASRLALVNPAKLDFSRTSFEPCQKLCCFFSAPHLALSLSATVLDLLLPAGAKISFCFFFFEAGRGAGHLRCGLTLLIELDFPAGPPLRAEPLFVPVVLCDPAYGEDCPLDMGGSFFPQGGPGSVILVPLFNFSRPVFSLCGYFLGFFPRVFFSILCLVPPSLHVCTQAFSVMWWAHWIVGFMSLSSL